MEKLACWANALVLSGLILLGFDGRARAVPNASAFIDEVMKSGKTYQKAQEVIATLGLNCGTPDQWEVFYEELLRALKAIGTVASEWGLQLATKRDFPTVCHVLTKPQLASYREGVHHGSRSRCILRGPMGQCLQREYIDIEQPKPEYYWPKYFIEVIEKGNDLHPKFARDNALFTASRSLANSLRGYIDVNGAIELTAYIMGGRHLLKSVGMDVGSVDSSKLAGAAALTPAEQKDRKQFKQC